MKKIAVTLDDAVYGRLIDHVVANIKSMESRSSAGGSASELLNRLTLPQLATMVNTSPQRLGLPVVGHSCALESDVPSAPATATIPTCTFLGRW